MRGLKAQLLKGNTDAAESLQRPDSNREGSPSSAAEQYFQERAYPASDVPANAYSIALNQYNLMNQPGGAAGWKELGPLSTPNGSNWGPGAAATISGRATTIAVDPSTCSGGSCGTIYLGTANGGIFKTTNGGQSWDSILDQANNEAIGSLVLDPNNANVIYAGTGEPNNAIDNNRGAGILKSTNGGRSWTTLGFDQFVNRAVADIVVDPSNSNNVYAISYVGRAGGNGTNYGSYNTPGLPPTGFFRSTDGGQHWTLSNPTPTLASLSGVRSGGTSLVRAADGTLYLGILAQGIYKSTDGGQHWTATGQPETSDFDRIGLASAPTDSKVLYAAVGHGMTSGDVLALYRSDDGGATWTKRTSTPNVCDTQCWYDMPLAVSPTNGDTVYLGGMFNYDGCGPAYPFPAACNSVVVGSTDGGKSWRDLGYSKQGDNVHPDDHVIVATANGGLYTGNDGGIFHSSTGGASWQSLNNGIGSMQFQGVSVNSNGYVFGGTQDNGTWMLPPNNSTNGVHILGGDGGMTAADPNNPNIVFDEFYGTQLERFDLSTGRQTWMAGWWCDYFCFGNGQFYQPVALGTKTPTGASASNNVFSGSNRVWRSMIGGGIDGNHNGDATSDPSDTTDFVPITPSLSSNVSVIAVNPTDPNKVAFATTNGQIYYTENALAPVQVDNACQTHSNDLVASYCNILASTNGIDLKATGQTMCSKPWTNALDTSSFCDYKSGITWTRVDLDASGNKVLPGRAVTALTFDPSGKLYTTFSGFDQNTPVANGSGHVFVAKSVSTTQGSTAWTNITSNLPNLPTNDLVVTNKGDLYAAADFGVFLSKDGGSTWARKDWRLANAPVYDLALSPDSKELYAATHGRGIWKIQIS